VGNVAGVYIGWRGQSLDASGWNVATLWDRKEVARRIGRTTGKELLLELNEWWKETRPLTMFVIGHSLGGAFLSQAMRGKLTGNVSDIELARSGWYGVVRAEENRETALKEGRKAKRAELGDLVVLVNPAIEASDYAPFDNDLPDRRPGAPATREELVAARLPYDKNMPYSCDQMPILLTVASEADTAVGRLFPLARWTEGAAALRATNFRSRYWMGLGWYSPYVTHRLSLSQHLSEAELAARKPRQIETENCGCPMSYDGLAPPKPSFDLAHTDRRQEFVAGGYPYVFAPTEERLKRGWDTSSPYFVVQATRDVISEHSDIFNPVFIGFLVNFIDAYPVRVKAAAKCRERSVEPQ